MRTSGIRYSALLHVVLIALLVFGLPDFLRKRPEPEPMAISVDVLPLAPVSNVKPQEKTPEKVEEKKPPQEQTARKATQEANKDAPKPQEKPIPVPAKEVVKKIVEKKKPEKPQKKPDEDLDSVLKSVAKTAKAEESKKPHEKSANEPNKNLAKSDHYDASMPLSMSEMDAIRNQIAKCWNPPAGAKDAGNLVVTLHIQMNADGSVLHVELASDKGRYMSDSFFRAAADSAMRAINLCSPIKNLPADKYGTWRDMEFTFDPKDFS